MDVNLEEKSKLNVVINFQFLFFGIRIDQSIAFQVTKVPKTPGRLKYYCELSGKGHLLKMDSPFFDSCSFFFSHFL